MWLLCFRFRVLGLSSLWFSRFFRRDANPLLLSSRFRFMRYQLAFSYGANIPARFFLSCHQLLHFFFFVWFSPFVPSFYSSLDRRFAFETLSPSFYFCNDVVQFIFFFLCPDFASLGSFSGIRGTSTYDLWRTRCLPSSSQARFFEAVTGSFFRSSGLIQFLPGVVTRWYIHRDFLLDSGIICRS